MMRKRDMKRYIQSVSVIALFCLSTILVCGLFGCNNNPSQFSYWYGDYVPSAVSPFVEISIGIYEKGIYNYTTVISRHSIILMNEDGEYRNRYQDGEKQNVAFDEKHILDMVDGNEEFFDQIYKQWLEDKLQQMKDGAKFSRHYLKFGKYKIRHNATWFVDNVIVNTETEKEYFRIGWVSNYNRAFDEQFDEQLEAFADNPPKLRYVQDRAFEINNYKVNVSFEVCYTKADTCNC